MTSNDESIPLANRKATIIGIGACFHTIATLAVVFRLYARFKLLHSPGWDDALVTLAVLSATIGTVFVCMMTDWGMGQHWSTLSPVEMEGYLFRFYVANGTYQISTTLIKLSLLCQYLRVFTSGTMRKICIALIVLISVWGLMFSFMAWFPCFPVRAYWNWAVSDAKCYAYGAKAKAPLIATYESHTATNFAFDAAVLMMPIPMCFRLDRSKREHWAAAGLCFLGSLIIIFSALRLVTILEHQAGWEPEMDFTWYCPISIIFACLEVDTAILAASMPVFWPMVRSGFNAIFVTHEVDVTYHWRDDLGDIVEDRASVRSSRGSDIALNKTPKLDPRKDVYVVEVDPVRGHDDREVIRAVRGPGKRVENTKWSNVLGVV